MPRFIFWPSSLAAPVNGAEIPKRISLLVTPRMAPLTLLSCPSGFEIGERAACCPCAGKSGACCACAVADGAAPGAAAIPAAGTSALFASATFAVTEVDGLETWEVNLPRAPRHVAIAVSQRWPTMRREPQIQPASQSGPPAPVSHLSAVLARGQAPAIRTLRAGPDVPLWASSS